MKKKYLVLLISTLLVSCKESSIALPSEDEMIQNAINTLKTNSYKVETSYVTEILRKDVYQTYQPLSIRLTENYNLTYQIGDVTAIEMGGSSKYEDILWYEESQSYEVVEGQTRVTTIDSEKYFKDEETGEVIREDLQIDNTINKTIMCDYDENEATYTPINFDSEFKNPFDYLTSSDFKKGDDDQYYLDGTKAVFLAKCYQRTSLTFVSDALVTFDSNNLISSITINIEPVDATSYTQTSSYTCVISQIGDIEIAHTPTYSNSNPELETLFNKVSNASSYTYYKEYSDDETYETYDDNVTCFYTQDVVFFHHFYSDYPERIYDGGYDYDYKVEYEYDEDTDYGVYYAYEYNKQSDSTPYDWALCYLSGTTPLTYDTFKDIGPTFYNINTSLFYKNEDGSYSVVDELLPTIGTYFDNQFIGVHSDVLDGTCTSFKLVLNDDNSGFSVYIVYTSESESKYMEFGISNIDNTTLPFVI